MQESPHRPPTTLLEAPVLQLAFRPFFLAAALCAVIAIPLWLVFLWTGLAPAGVSTSWHIHEMLTGFAATTILGFVLTAVQTWTGQRSVHGGILLLMLALWFVARICWLLGPALYWPGAIADGLLFLFAAGAMARLVYRARNWRNAFFVAVFLAFAVFSGLYTLALEQGDFNAARALQDFVFYLIVHVVLVVGGRVIPFFSDRLLGRPETQRYRWLELAALLSSVTFMLAITYSRTGATLQVCAALVAMLNLLRWLSWKPWQSRSVALLWSLHTAYAFLILGFSAIAVGLPISVSVHIIAVGGIGLMILAMISRVSLGHSGRPLELPPGLVAAYCALVVAALSRALAGMLPHYYLPLLAIAAAAWTLGFALFLYRYLPILTTPRVDGKPG